MPDISILKQVTSVSTDIFVVIAIWVMLLFYAIYIGKKKMISLILSFYPAILLFLNFSYKDKLLLADGSSVSSYLNTIVIFLLFLIPIHLVMNRVIGGDFSHVKSKRFFQTGILSLAGTALVILVSYHVIPVKNIYTFGDSLNTIFAPEGYFFWWLLAPLIAVFISKR